MSLTRSQQGGGLLIVIILTAVVGMAVASIVMRTVNHAKIVQTTVQKSDMRRILAEYAAFMRGPEAYRYNLARNADLHQFVVAKVGAAPNPCPRLEACAAPPGKPCAANAPRPACDTPPPRSPMAAFDGVGRPIIPKMGVYLDARFAPTSQGMHRWTIRAFWRRQSQHRAHYELTIDRHVPPTDKAMPGIKSGTMVVPAEACFKQRGEPFRRGWGAPIFDSSWHGTDNYCPNGYKLTGGWAYTAARHAHPDAVYPDPWNTKRLVSSFVNDALRPDIRINLTTHPNNPDSSAINFAVLNCCWEDDDFTFE